jgi:DNA primase
MFPLADARGRVLGFGARALRDNQQPKYLNSGEGEVYHKGRQLFGADIARAQAARDQLVILVEGYTDVLAMHQAGLANAVGLMGTALTEHQVAELSRLTGADGRVVLALDADASGQEAMERAARVAAGRDLDLRVVELPAGADPADLVTSEGADAMRKRVEGSMPFARFRVERVLDASDTSSADGRDRALARVREAISPLPPSALREELVRLVAGRLGLSEQLVGSLTATTGPTPAPPARPGAPGPAAAGGRARVALDRREQIERTFLALCIALPEAGRDALRRVDLDSHFTNGLLRRAAAHLREHLVAPLDGIAVGDGELESLLAELSLRAAGEPAEPATLEVQTLQLETARLEREIAMARASGSLDVSDYAETLSRVRQDLDDAMDRAMEARPAEPAG